MTQKYLLEYKYFPASDNEESGRFGQYVTVYSYTFCRSDSTEKQLEVVKACLDKGDTLIAAWSIDWKDLQAKYTRIYNVGNQPHEPATKMLGRIRQQHLSKEQTSSVYKPNVSPVSHLPAVVAKPAEPVNDQWSKEPIFRYFPYPIAAKAAGEVSQ